VVTADQSDPTRIQAMMSLNKGMVIQELGWDEDVDDDLRNVVMDIIDDDLVEEAFEAVDAVLLWWRADDGDVTDGLVDALTDLSPSGAVWLLTPKVGRPGAISSSDIAEAAETAGLSLASPVDVSHQWQAQRAARPKSARR